MHRCKNFWLTSVASALQLAVAPAVVAASEPDASSEPPGARYSLHMQATYVEQESLPFHAPYSGPNSLSPGIARETADLTVYLGLRLWSGAEAWINPEIDQGFGLNDTLGVAGFPSGEAYKVGRHQPYFRLPRLFVRQTFDREGPREPAAGAPNSFAGGISANRWVVTFGKFAVTDVFDTNTYAHDPRGDFLNWAAVDTATFDYAADAWGYTVGTAVERYQGAWTLRAGAFDLSNIPNSAHLEPGFHEFQLIGEFERRFVFRGSPGRALLTLFENRGRMGLLNEAVERAQETGQPVDITAVRSYRSRFGASVGLEQQLSSDLGAFARIGKASGNVEAYEFTDVDRTLAAGVSLKGSGWRRPGDSVGIAAIVNGISAARERYLNAGGLGILIGDGKLPHPGVEKILETYYEITTLRVFQMTLDYQWICHPAYNVDRGPVSVVAVRVHMQL